MSLREKIETEALAVFGGAARKQSRELADAILAIPEIAGREVSETRPFDAFDGGARVLGAVREVLYHGGTPARALVQGERALSDLRPKLADALNLGHTISTQDKRKPV